jgi:hypothetical protein
MNEYVVSKDDSDQAGASSGATNNQGSLDGPPAEGDKPPPRQKKRKQKPPAETPAKEDDNKGRTAGCWMMTLNNPSEDEKTDCVEYAKMNCTRAVIALEEGESGTPQMVDVAKKEDKPSPRKRKRAPKKRGPKPKAKVKATTRKGVALPDEPEISVSAAKVPKGKLWLMTLNNPKPGQKQSWIEALLKVDIIEEWVVQLEEGEEGTPHLQGAFKCSDEMVPTGRILLDFPVHYQMVIERKDKKGHDAWWRIANYCQKQKGQLEKPVFSSDKVPRHDGYDCEEPFGWHLPVIKMLDKQWKERDRRTINWIWADRYDIDKSSLLRWFAVYKHNVCLVSGNRADVKCAVAIPASKGHEPRYVFVDIPRALGNTCSVKALEEIKDATFESSKYESGTVSLKRHPVITVFANKPPNLEQACADRWNVVCLDPYFACESQAAHVSGTD